MKNDLFLILKPYDSWFNHYGEKKNLEAKAALYKFYKKLTTLKPEKKYNNSHNFIHYSYHISYICYLIKIKQAFIEKKYMRACNELRSLNYYEPFFQARIYYNVLKLLEEELDIKGGVVF